MPVKPAMPATANVKPLSACECAAAESAATATTATTAATTGAGDARARAFIGGQGVRWNVVAPMVGQSDLAILAMGEAGIVPAAIPLVETYTSTERCIALTRVAVVRHSE